VCVLHSLVRHFLDSRISRLRVVKNKVLRKLCGPKMEEVKNYLRKLHNKALHNLYSSPKCSETKVRVMRKTRHVAFMEERTGS